MKVLASFIGMGIFPPHSWQVHVLYFPYESLLPVTQLEKAREQAMLPPSAHKEPSELPDGTALPAIATDELVAMRKVFDFFDTNKDGTITSAEIGKLHDKLGEPLESKISVQA